MKQINLFELIKPRYKITKSINLTMVGIQSFIKHNYDDEPGTLFESYLEEGGLSRLYQHTKDDNTFAIIGSKDKDTGEDRFKKLLDLVKKASAQANMKNQHISWKHLIGAYTYVNSDRVDTENSLIIYGIQKQQALNIAKKLNQESIIWKDQYFFGILYLDGSKPELLSNDIRNLDFNSENVQEYGSRFFKGRNRDKKWAFKSIKVESVVSDFPGHGCVFYMNSNNCKTHNELLFELKV